MADDKNNLDRRRDIVSHLIFVRLKRLQVFLKGCQRGYCVRKAITRIMISIAKKLCLLTYHMLFPRLLRSGGLQLLQVLELGVEFVHPVGFPLVRHLVFLQEFQGSFAALKPLHNLTTKTSLNQTQV